MWYLLLSQNFSTFQLKKTLSGFSVTYSNCQHHYFCTLGSLLIKIGLLEHKPYNTLTIDLVTKIATKCLGRGACTMWICLAKPWFTFWVEWNKTAWYFIMILGMAWSWKLLNGLYLGFSIQYYQTVVNHGKQIRKSETTGNGGTAVVLYLWYI